ncbi:MAG: hypothetical protein HC765_14325, partial [Brachymonas sp.]|nr:hypothetical protein [Brachymonas sp.]
MFRNFTLALALLLACQVSVAAPARETTSVLQAESASARQESCAECYEFKSDSVCALTLQYGPHPERDFTTGILFLKTHNSAGQSVFAYLHHDHLQTPLQATGIAGNLLWAAHYNAFGRASIVTPAPTAQAPTINLALRLPGQYEDSETGFHYNFRRYYDPDTGRYWTQDPRYQIWGLEGGINQYGYAHADPINLTDPTGEIAPAVALLGAAATCMSACMASTAAEDLI